MIRIRLHGISLILTLFSLTCFSQSYSVFSKVSKVNKANACEHFVKYCQIDSLSNFQQNSYLCSLVGDYAGALHFATKDAIVKNKDNPAQKLTVEENQSVKKQLDQLLIDSINNSQEQKLTIGLLQNLLNMNKNVEELFTDKIQFSAKKYIIEQSKNYHFLLLNEAHHNAQNRAFTMELLKPLWEKGYRYLALEALGYKDQNLMERGYPCLNTGYYIKEPVFGNLVREALAIGYKLISYEAQLDLRTSLTARDAEQAKNIYNATYKKDTVGKVIIHAGYSHISEFGDANYKPMGSQLRELSNQEIFTIDQESMTEFDKEEAMNPYYRYAVKTFKITEPSVFLNSERKAFVEPLNTGAIDVQVYHPLTIYTKGRPSWLLNVGLKPYELVPEILTFHGNLLQALVANEDSTCVPSDQLIISKNKALILKPGNYLLKIIDRNGALIGTSTLQAK